MPDAILQEIKDRLNVADVIAAYIPLKRSGSTFKAVCPFHSDHNPSLSISPQKQIWHCFACGEGGDIFGFVMKQENLGFKDAVKLLADKAGVTLPTYSRQNKEQDQEKEQLTKINSFATKLYHAILFKPQGERALAYLNSRGLSLDTIKQWQLGYAPDDFHTLEKALSKKGVHQEELVKAGLSIKNDKGQIYDRFRGRITFPIYNYLAETVGFTARILSDDPQQAKYINSPETLIYSKSKVLFGLNFAKNSIRKLDEVIIVEGQMDCISPHQAGFTNVVASSGTALTTQQLDLLSRLTRNIKLCFDADAAGLSAVKRAVELYLGKEFVIKIVTLGGAKDPDELIRESPEKFASAVKNAPLFLDFYIDKAFSQFNGSSVEQKKLIAKEILPLLRYLTDPLEQDHYIQVLAEKFNTTPNILREALKKSTTPKKTSAPSATSPKERKKFQTSALEKEILGGMLMEKEFLQTVLEQGEVEDFESPEVREIVRPIFTAKVLNKQSVSRDSVLVQEAIFMVESLGDEFEGKQDALLRQLQKSFALLRLQSIKRQQQILTQEIKQAEQLGKKTELEGLNKKFVAIINLRMQFERLVNY